MTSVTPSKPYRTYREFCRTPSTRHNTPSTWNFGIFFFYLGVPGDPTCSGKLLLLVDHAEAHTHTHTRTHTHTARSTVIHAVRTPQQYKQSAKGEDHELLQHYCGHNVGGEDSEGKRLREHVKGELDRYKSLFIVEDEVRL